MFDELKARLRYQIDDIFSRGSLIQLILLVVLSLIVVLLGMTAFYFGLFSPENAEVEGIGGRIDRGFWDSLWWSLKHLIDPGVFADNYGASGAVIAVSLLISIMGMVIFGILIGFISTSMEARLASLQQGNSPVRESGHVLILGWSNKIILILRLLSIFQPGTRVVVLSRLRVSKMQEPLRAEGLANLPVKVILRSGNPTNINELSRVAFEHSSSIIILAASSRDADSSGRDVDTIKIAMLLSAFTGWSGARPNLVSEISRKQNIDVARIAGRDTISIVSTSEVISKIIVQSARQSGLSHVYAEILSADGNSIFVANEPRCVGQRFGNIVYRFANAIPIGICWRNEELNGAGYSAGLNPEPDYVMEPGDHVVLLSRSSSAKYDANVQPVASTQPASKANDVRPLGRILVLGFNDNVYDILSEFDGHMAVGGEIHLVSNLEADEAMRQLERHVSARLSNIEMSITRGDTVSAAFLNSLDVLAYDCIITLADESNYGDPDARSIMMLLLLGDILDERSGESRSHVVSEILDPRNRELVARTVADDVVVSPEIVSMQLSQISRQPVLESIYRELLSAGGFEICLKPASRYVDTGVACDFDALQLAAQGRMEIAIGVRIADQGEPGPDGHGVHLNPQPGTSWQFGNGDSVVVLAQELYE